MKCILYDRYAYRLLCEKAFLFFLLLACCACTGKKETRGTDYRALARAGIALGVDIEEYDNHSLFLEAASWVGTPYLYGGNTRRGVDCSGLSSNIYATVFRVNLSRSCREQYQNDCRHKLKNTRHLSSGDLVFFRSGSGKGKVNHVGVYLKNGNFIHASSSRGVVVDNLNSGYWAKNWLAGGRVFEK